MPYVSPFEDTPVADAGQLREIAGENDNVLRRSLRGGIYGAGSQLASVGDTIAETLGAEDVSQSLRNYSGELRAQAQLPQNSPKVGSFAQLRDNFSLGNLGEYAGGIIGGSLPVTAAGLAGGLVTGGAGFVPAVLGAAAATTPFNMGDIIQKQQADPEAMQRSAGLRLTDAALGGGGAAIVEGIVPGMVAGKLLGRGGAQAAKQTLGQTVGRNALDIPLEGLAEGTGEAIKQTAANSAAPLDWSAIGENAIGGAVGGTVFTGVGTAADLASSAAPRAGDALGEAYEGGKKLWGSKLEQMKAAAAGVDTDAIKAETEARYEEAGKKVGSLWDDVMAFGEKIRTRDSIGDKINADEPVGYTNEEMSAATPEKAWEMLKRNTDELATWGKEKGTEMLDKMGVDDARRQELSDAIDSLSDPEQAPTAAKVIAGFKAAGEKAEKAGEHLTKLWGSLQKGRAQDESPDVKKSADDEGVTQIVMQVLSESGLKTARPDIFNPRDKGYSAGRAGVQLPLMARSISELVRQSLKGPLDENAKLYAFKVFGDQTVPLMNAVAKAVGESDVNRKGAEALFTNIAEMRKVENTTRDLEQTILEYSAPGMEKVNESQLDALQDMLMRHANGEAAPRGGFKREGVADKGQGDIKNLPRSAQDIATEAEIDFIYSKHFGKNADVVRKAVEKAAKTKNGVLQVDAVDTQVDEDGNEIEDDSVYKVPKGQAILRDADGNKIGSIRKEGEFDNDGNRLEAEQLNVMKFGLTAPDKSGNQKMSRNGRMYRDVKTNPKADNGKNNYVTQHLMDLQNKYPDKNVSWVESTPAVYELDPQTGKPTDKLLTPAQGHIEVSDKLTADEVSDTDVAQMALDTHKYPNSKSRIDFVGKDGKPLADYVALDSMRVGRVMGARGKDSFQRDGAPQPYPEQMRDNFMSGLTALALKFNAIPQIPDEAIIGYTKNGPLTWGEAKKLGRTADSTPEQRERSEAQRHLAEMQRSMFTATASDAQIRALNEKAKASAERLGMKPPAEIKRTNLSDRDKRELQRDIMRAERWLDRSVQKEQNMTDGDTAKAEAGRDLDATRPARGKELVRPAGLSTWYNSGIDAAMTLPPGQRSVALRELAAEYDSRMAAANPRKAKTKNDDFGRIVRSRDEKTGKVTRSLENPVDTYDSVWKTSDDPNVDGRITAEGVRMLLEGNYDGGFGKKGSTSRIDGESQEGVSGYDEDGLPIMSGVSTSRTNDPLARFDGGLGRTARGKDEQVHMQFAGSEKDLPFNGGDMQDPSPQNYDAIHRANMDGSAHFLSDRATDVEVVANMGREMLAKTTKAQKSMGEKLVALAKPEVVFRMKMAEYDQLMLASMPDLTPSSRYALIEPLFAKFGGPAEEVRTTGVIERRNEKKGKGQQSVIEYDTLNDAFAQLQERIEMMSDNQVAVELRRRNYIKETGIGGADLQAAVTQEIAMLKERQAKGRVELADVQFNPTEKQKAAKLKGKYAQDLFGNNGPAPRADVLADLYNMGRVKIESGSKRAEGMERPEPGLFDDGPTFPVRKKTAPAAAKAEKLSAEEQLIRATSGTPEPAGSRKKEGLPGPKALAAKKAALLQAASSSNPALAEQVAASSDVGSLQRTVVALIDGGDLGTGTTAAIAAVNERLTELVKADPQNALDLTRRVKVDKERKFSKDATKADATTGASDATRKAVEEHLLKVLGPKVSVEWAGLSKMAYAGDYTHKLKAIRLSLHAADPMSTAFHESLHAFLAAMRDAGATDVAKVLEQAASSQHVIKQLEEIYKGKPEVLAQLKDPEERAAYMYQHWVMDKSFQVGAPAATFFQKLSKFIRNLFGVWSNDERALHIMDQFQGGLFGKNHDKPSYVRHIMMDGHKNTVLEGAQNVTEPLAGLADAIFGAGGDRLRDTNIPALGQIADIIKRKYIDGAGGDRGYILNQRREMTQRITALGKVLDEILPKDDTAMQAAAKATGLSTGQTSREGFMKQMLEALQTGEKAATPEARIAVSRIKKVLRETRSYMVEAGVDVGDLGPDYFPREWDSHYISQNQQAFRDMLEPYIRSGKMKGTADTLIRNLTAQGGSELGIEARETREPGMQFKKERVLSFLDQRDVAPFLKKDLMTTMASYITQATRKAEWTRRLGNGKLDELIETARGQGATQDHLNLVEDYLKSNDGTLGDDLNPTARRLMGDMIVYQNIRLLPLAGFSMMIDPLGTVVRGAEFKESWSTFKRGIAGIKATITGTDAEPDAQTKWAELVGTVDSAMMTHAMADVYTQGMVGGTAKSINEKFFKYNMVESLNRNFRIGATESAMKFIVRHADGKSKDSLRWINELGLEDGDVKVFEGRLALTEAEGLNKASVQRVHNAVNQWVDGAVLRPDAADKPIWMNDPHWALISHLKQFVYSFQKTILARVWHEIQQNNYAPVMALSAYLPVMMAADFAKNFIVNAGDTPEWQKGWDAWDYIGNGMERAGFFGVSQFGLDAAQDIHRGGSGVFRLAGPTIEQGRDVIDTLGGRRQFGTTAIDALPANALYKPTLTGEATPDPVFAE